MPVTFTIKNVPDHIADSIRDRAKSNHRSVQGELMAIIEATVKPRYVTVRELGERAKELGLKSGDESTGRLTAREAYERVRATGLRTGNDSTRWIREDRDAR